MSTPQIRVLGPIGVSVDGVRMDLSKRRHREIIAILVALRGRAIPTADLAEELWDGMPPNGAVGAIRSFVGELRRILEPHRKPRTLASVLVTVADGYALRLDANAVDAWRFETALAGAVGAAPTMLIHICPLPSRSGTEAHTRNFPSVPGRSRRRRG
ncbi:AfsR/SARP family transcriptional regulator [Arthrobacter sp. YN]|uniref:AfsR/SARP family transcriptional regulator n=1 Tax=Arthrobacter sp. YN TaxID=2020486 RepID=UPI001E56EAAB|nr:hypothetical protein [Arthrobacter sp. YN]